MTQHVRQQRLPSIQRKSPKPQSNSSMSSPVNIDINNLTPDGILQLQRQFGNTFVKNLLQRQLDQTTQTGNAIKIQRKPQTSVIQRGDKEEEQGLISSDETTNDFGTLGFEPEPEEKSSNPFESDDVPDQLDIDDENNPFSSIETPDHENTDEDDPFKGWGTWGDEKEKGQDPKLKVDKYGEDGKFGKVKNRGQVGYTGYKFDNSISELTDKKSGMDWVGTGVKQTGKGIKYGAKQTVNGVQKGVKHTGKGVDNLLGTNMFKDKGNDDNEKGWWDKAKNAWSKIKSALKTIAHGIETGFKAGVNFFSPVMEAIGKVTDALKEIAGYGIPIVSSMLSIITGAYSVYSSWSTYQTYNISGEEAYDLLQANEDENTNEKSKLLTETKLGQTFTYAAAKTWRAFWSKIVSFGLTLVKGISEIASLFTGGIAGLGVIISSLAKSTQTAVGYAKALYKISKGTKGVKRAKHASILMAEADGGDETALKTLVDLGLTGDMWMFKLSKKLGVTYDPTYKDYTEVLYSRALGQIKDKVVSYGSGKTDKLAKGVRGGNKWANKKLPNKLSKIIEKQFINTNKHTALALMVQPRTTDEMHMYLQNLKEVDMYADFSKEVMSSMKSN